MELVLEICEKLGINPYLQLKRAIRGLPGFTAADLIFALIHSNNMSEAADILGYSTEQAIKTSSRSLLHPIFSERSQNFITGGSVKSWRTDLLGVINRKYCSSCEKILPLYDFRNHTGKSLNKSVYCCRCMTADNKKYKLNLIQRTPIWADLVKIKEVYINCPPDMEVDHIIPLNGTHVSGLHVHTNLQYLSPKDNHIKNNTYSI